MSDQKKDPTNVDLDDFLDLDFGNNTKTQADSTPKSAGASTRTNEATPSLDLNKAPETKRDAPKAPQDRALSSKEELELEFANSKSKVTPAPTLDFETTANDEAEPTPAPSKPKAGFISAFGKKDKKPKAEKPKADKPKSGSLFGKKTKKTADNTGLGNDPTSAPTPKPAKKLSPVLFGGVAIGLVVLAGLLFFLLGNEEAPTEPVTPPPVASSPTPPPPPADTTPPPAPAEATPPAPTEMPATTTAGSEVTPMMTAPAINPDEILKAEIPEDPALLKEEIDRLADTEKQLAEQSKMIKEQLDLMNDLTKAKDEEIALLEAQIAELEQQKAGK